MRNETKHQARIESEESDHNSVEHTVSASKKGGRRSVVPITFYYIGAFILVVMVTGYVSLHYFLASYMAAVNDMAAAGQRRVGSTQLYFISQEIIYGQDDISYARSQQVILGDVWDSMAMLHNGILNGNNTLGLTNSVYRLYNHDTFLFDPSCLRLDNKYVLDACIYVRNYTFNPYGVFTAVISRLAFLS